MFKWQSKTLLHYRWYQQSLWVFTLELLVLLVFFFLVNFGMHKFAWRRDGSFGLQHDTQLVWMQLGLICGREPMLMMYKCLLYNNVFLIATILHRKLHFSNSHFSFVLQIRNVSAVRAFFFMVVKPKGVKKVHVSIFCLLL